MTVQRPKLAGRVLLLSLLALAASRAVSAQGVQASPSSAGWQMFAGYASMTESDVTDKETFPTGWAVSAAVHLTHCLSVTGDVDGQYKTIPSIGSDIHLTSHAVSGGLRASATLGHFVEFGQILGGVVQSAGTAFGATDTTTHAAVQPGLGLDYQLGRRWAIRGELDVRFISTGQEIRVATGIVRAFR